MSSDDQAPSSGDQAPSSGDQTGTGSSSDEPQIAEQLHARAVSEVNLTRHSTVTSDTSVADTVAKMADEGFATTCVVDNDRLVGLFTQRDYVLGAAGRPDAWTKAVSSEMVTVPLITLDPNQSLSDGLRLMNSWWISSVPVVDGDRFVGNLSYYTVMEAITQLLDSKLVSASESATDMTVRDGLSFIDFTGINTTPPVMMTVDEPAHTVVHHVRARGLPLTLVVDESNHLVGTVSEFDLLTKVGCQVAHIRTVPVGEIMNTAPASIPARTSVADAMALLVANESSSVPLVGESGRPVGTASFHDITGYIESTLASLG